MADASPAIDRAQRADGAPALISASGLGKRYGRRQVLDGVDLAIGAGEVVGLLGQNGSGKSTLLRCLLGLTLPDRGASRVFAEDSTVLGAAQKQRIGYVPQLPTLQNWMRVEQMLSYVAAFYPTWDAARVADLCRRWEIPGARKVQQLSPGEQQRLSIVLAMGHRPSLLVLDEPAASLDPSARRQAVAAILEAATVDGATVLFSTHLTSDIERIASRVLILRAGRIAIDGDLGELKDGCKRLRVRVAELPADLQLPGQISCDRRADGALFTVLGDIAGAVARLERLPGAAVVVEDLSLEDIFVEMHRP